MADIFDDIEEALVVVLATALEKYGQHDETCLARHTVRDVDGSYFRGDGKCDCGLEKALAAARGSADAWAPTTRRN